MAAEDVSNKMARHFFRPTFHLVQARAPQQRNNYDCGVHMLAAAQIFASMESGRLEDYEAILREKFADEPDKICVEFRRRIEKEILLLAKTAC